MVQKEKNLRKDGTLTLAKKEAKKRSEKKNKSKI
jgi:hypothetical protein